jgi:hypothetical protein
VLSLGRPVLSAVVLDHQPCLFVEQVRDADQPPAQVEDRLVRAQSAQTQVVTEDTEPGLGG